MPPCEVPPETYVEAVIKTTGTIDQYRSRVRLDRAGNLLYADAVVAHVEPSDTLVIRASSGDEFRPWSRATETSTASITKVSRHGVGYDISIAAGLVLLAGGIALSTAYAFVCASWQQNDSSWLDLHCAGPTFLAFALTAGVSLPILAAGLHGDLVVTQQHLHALTVAPNGLVLRF